ncbi:hypothetical protein EDC01DRAFT_710110 [Geopyxis carbonaria]|nr:hypothetical protein EDC01DRAFT_710110 [Geopyxis carbonaria]
MASNTPPLPTLLRAQQKSAAAPAAVDTETVELKDMIASAPPPELGLKDDIMNLARHGEETAIRELLAAGKASADFRDEDGLSPLHWASINNRYGTVKMLLEHGADVDAHGGESDATPAMWAAQRGHYYIVNLLLQNGASTTMVDSSGYNLLHLATFDGNVFLLILLLHNGIAVDSRDQDGHTSLMWAAYKGFPNCVDLFLRWGADIHAVDDTGFTALHWALVRGNYGCIEKLLEYGVDRFVANNEGKTPAMVAEELKTQKVWWDALDECGYDRHGNALHQTNTILGIPVRDKETAIKRFFFLWPTFEILVIVQCLCWMPWFFGIPVALVMAFGMHYLATLALKWAKPGEKAIHKTPYLAGIFAGTAFWVLARWAWRIFPVTFWTVPFSNLLFLISFGGCLYFYYICIAYDPGFVPKLPGHEDQKEVVTNLLSLWKYDEQNFCVQCMIRMPLRSKHCWRCKRCVTKHDHHCPWIHNCVGTANHRQFFLFVLTMELGIFMFVRIVLAYFSALPPGDNPTCAVLSDTPLCPPLHSDPFTVFVALWATAQTTWVTMLLTVQLVQIAKAQTTYESMRSSRHGHGHSHGHPHAAAAATALTTAITTGATSNPVAPSGPEPVRPPPESWWRRTTKLLGVDVFVKTAQSSQARERGNPFSVGVLGNCRDFWGGPTKAWRPPMEGGMGAEGLMAGRVVDWARIYETPRPMRAGGRGAAGRYEQVEGEEV